MEEAISRSPADPISGAFSTVYPIYHVFSNFDGIGATYTGKGTSLHNHNFSFRAAEGLSDVKYITDNLSHYAHVCGFDYTRVTWPNGAWPHSGQAIKAEDYTWNPHPRENGIVPVTSSGQSVTYDGIVTRSPGFVLGVQGADCPAVFLYDPVARVIGLAHSGWRPVVRGVIRNTIDAMAALGANPSSIVVHIAPGVGDKYNEFHWDEAVEPHIKEVFILAGREDLLTDRKIRHEMTDQDRAELRLALGRDTQGKTSFMLTSLITAELERCGISSDNITHSPHSTVVECYPIDETGTPLFRYHSARRDMGPDPKRPRYGLNMSTMFIKPTL